MFLTAALFGGIGGAIYRGRTDLIHSYHQENVADRVAYGKAVGKALLLIAGTMLCSGVISLLGRSEKSAVFSVAVLAAGLVLGLARLVTAQKKHNGGIF